MEILLLVLDFQVSNCHTDNEKSCQCKNPGFISMYCTPRPHNFRNGWHITFLVRFVLDVELWVSIVLK